MATFSRLPLKAGAKILTFFKKIKYPEIDATLNSETLLHAWYCIEEFNAVSLKKLHHVQ